MGWQDREYGRGDAGGGRFRAFLGRVFGDGENPLSWSVPLFTAIAIRVKVHVFFIIFIVMQLIWSASKDAFGVGYMAMGLGLLFVLVLLHEFGHCIACRRVGGDADEIVMWPLGGLAMCHPPFTWQAHLATAVGGPLVNVAFLPVFAGALLAAGAGMEAVVFNPFTPAVPLGALDAWWKVGLWWAHYMNVVLLGFNVLTPMYPLDGGRIVQCALWAKLGYERATDIATKVGMVGAAVLFMLGMVTGETMLMGIAIFGGLTCWMERRRLAFAGDGGAMAMEGASAVAARREQREFERLARRQAEEREERAALQREVDTILEKISREGMGSLTKREKDVLRRASARERAG